MEAVLEKKIKPMSQPSFDVGVVPIGFGKRIYNVLFLLKIKPTAFVKSRSGDLARLFAEMMAAFCLARSPRSTGSKIIHLPHPRLPHLEFPAIWGPLPPGCFPPGFLPPLAFLLVERTLDTSAFSGCLHDNRS